MKRVITVLFVLAIVMLSSCKEWQEETRYQLRALTNNASYSAEGRWSLFAGSLSLAEGDFFLFYTEESQGAIRLRRVHSHIVTIYEYDADRQPEAVKLEYWSNRDMGTHDIYKTTWRLYIPRGTIAPIFNLQQGWEE